MKAQPTIAMSETTKFPRTIRLDVSDLNVFPAAAEPGEWAVPGTFAYSDTEPDSLSGKEQLAFKGGWLGVESFGRSTFVQVSSVTYAQLDTIVERLAAHFVAHYGAPDMPAAIPAAQEEANDAIGLCAHEVGTLLAIERTFTEDGVAEKIRVVEPPGEGLHAKIWEIVEDGE